MNERTDTHMGDTRPLISVIMPCYNAAPYVAEAVESVMGQSHGNVELVVVDDGSTDGSDLVLKQLAEKYPERLHLFYTSHVGPYPARNLALRHARGDYVAFLDADDWWLPETLARLHAAIARRGADVAYCGWQNVGEGIHSEPHVPPAYEEEDAVAHFVRTCPWPIHGALVKRAIVDQLRGFSERRFSSMDYDFWLRMLALTKRIVRVPEVLAFYRWHSYGQVSSVKWRQVLDALEAQQSFIRANPKLVAHLPEEKIRDLTHGQVMRQAYRAVWKRDLESAQKLFRHSAARGAFHMRDLRHIASALLPMPLYRGIISLVDRKRA